jgi:hypothetical protein
MPLFIGVHSTALHTSMLGQVSQPTQVINAFKDDGRSSIMSSFHVPC